MGNLINNNLSTTSSSNTTSTNQSDNTQFTTDARIAKRKALRAKLQAANTQANTQSATAKADDVLSSVDSLLYQATTTEVETAAEQETELPKLSPNKFSVANDNTHENWGGLGEKWIKNEAGDWHYMILNEETGETDVYKWDSGTKAGMTNGEDTKVGSFDAKYFNDPSELGPEKPEDLFVANNKTYDNWGGLGEKWVKNDQGQWHYLIQNEETGETDVYRWDSGTKEGMKNGEDTKVASLSSDYYNEPNTLGSTSLSEKRTTFKRSEQGTFDNYLGKGEKWIQNEVGEWHYIVLENELDETTNTYSQIAKLFQWTSGSKEAAMNGEDTLLSNIDLKYFVDPSLLETDPIQLLETASKEARDGGELLADTIETASQDAQSAKALEAE